MPDLYTEHINTINQEMLSLWEKGYINIDFLADDPVITLSKKSLIDSEVNKLTKDEQWSIMELKRLMFKKET
jgi:hypothetical protein